MSEEICECCQVPLYIHSEEYLFGQRYYAVMRNQQVQSLRRKMHWKYRLKVCLISVMMMLMAVIIHFLFNYV